MQDGICSWDDDALIKDFQPGVTRLKLMDILLLTSKPATPALPTKNCKKRKKKG
jgi:hypothetical protein